MAVESEPSHRQPGRLAGHVDDAFFENLPHEELDAWSQSLGPTVELRRPGVSSRGR